MKILLKKHTDSTALGLGDTEADVALIGDGAVYESLSMVEKLHEDRENICTGLKALAFGLGRNEEALAFRCFVAVPGDIGTADADPSFWTDSLFALGFDVAGREPLAPLKGGIA
jgi:hypothetical protein